MYENNGKLVGVNKWNKIDKVNRVKDKIKI